MSSRSNFICTRGHGSLPPPPWRVAVRFGPVNLSRPYLWLRRPRRMLRPLPGGHGMAGSASSHPYQGRALEISLRPWNALVPAGLKRPARDPDSQTSGPRTRPPVNDGDWQNPVFGALEAPVDNPGRSIGPTPREKPLRRDRPPPRRVSRGRPSGVALTDPDGLVRAGTAAVEPSPIRLVRRNGDSEHHVSGRHRGVTGAMLPDPRKSTPTPGLAPCLTTLRMAWALETRWSSLPFVTAPKVSRPKAWLIGTPFRDRTSVPDREEQGLERG